jgi:phosphopantetheinyl transferase
MPLVDDIDVRERTYTECRDILHREEVDELNAAIAQSSRGKQPVVDRLVARAYLRRVLAEYPTVTASPCDLVFCRNKHGKPELVCGDAPSPIRFNLTHTKGVVGVAVSTENAIGIDVEAQARETREIKLAQKYFSKDELAVLQGMLLIPIHVPMTCDFFNWCHMQIFLLGRRDVACLLGYGRSRKHT